MWPAPGASPSLIGDVLRHSLGLSAWKQFHDSRPSTGSGRRELVERRWSLRVNPSSGNLHPTEAYVVSATGVYHYAADRHALEQRCAFTAQRRDDSFLVALTSIHWREAWKYGERAFRYCQHDLGHAIAAVRIAAAIAGLHAEMLPEWSQPEIAALTGTDRDQDFVEAEREEPGCLIVVGPGSLVGGRSALVVGRNELLRAAREGTWTGKASQLSEAHVEWTFIDEIARATEDPGRARGSTGSPRAVTNDPAGSPRAATPDPLTLSLSKGEALPYTRALTLQRRSAVALDGRSSISAERFFDILARAMPDGRAPWDGLWWDARIHLALFVHRVDGVDPGLYVLVRSARGREALERAMTRDFLWQPASDRLPLFLLARGDCRRLAERVSCDQEIAADGFFSLGMLAEFDASLAEFGPAFYRHLFWESGVVGQVLYLAAEAAGTRGTGIGCFYDDPVHDVFGLVDHTFQSLYHFTIGVHIEDTRLTTERGYSWEESRAPARPGIQPSAVGPV